MNNNNLVILVSKYSKTGKKNKELLSQPFADWGHPNPLIIFRCLSGTAFETFLSSLPNGKKCKINVQTFNSNKQISNMYLNS
ncbi:unnamed protein product, partial [marine sediment metagenome]